LKGGRTVEKYRDNQRSYVQSSNMAEPIEVPFGFRARLGPRHYLLDGFQIPLWEGAILVERDAQL